MINTDKVAALEKPAGFATAVDRYRFELYSVLADDRVFFALLRLLDARDEALEERLRIQRDELLPRGVVVEPRLWADLLRAGNTLYAFATTSDVDHARRDAALALWRRLTTEADPVGSAFR